MSWVEFSNLLNGLLGESPLGHIVSIRAENDPERLKGFNRDQKKIRSEWRSKIDKERISKMTVAEKEKATSQLQNMFKTMFSNK